MKKIYPFIALLGLSSGVVQAQMGPGGPPDEMPPPPPDFIPDFEVPQDVLDLRDDLKASRDALRESREAALGALAEDATREDKVAALQQWHEENAEAISASEVLAQELRELVREYRPERPEPVEVPEEIAAAQESLKALRDTLGADREALLASLKEAGATQEEVRAELDAWRETNAATIDEAKALADQVRDWFRENRPNRPERGKPDRMKNRRENFRENAMAMKSANEDFRNEIQGLTGPERAAAIRQYREELKELMDARKQLKREERLGDGSEGGDRRGG